MNNFEFTHISDGWIWKALDVPFTNPSTKERPQIQAVESVEKDYQELFDQTLVDIVKSISKYLIK